MNLKLIRAEMGPEGTFGVLLLDGKSFCVTLERPWQDNKPDISCIPAGTYKCSPVNSHRFGETLQVDNVPGRSEIIFHQGNYVDDSRGCILVARSYGILGLTRAILTSRPVFTRFREVIQNKAPYILEIVES